jgi:hypothetical protein
VVAPGQLILRLTVAVLPRLNGPGGGFVAAAKRFVVSLTTFLKGRLTTRLLALGAWWTGS